MQSVAILCRRKLEAGDELFADYRLSPNYPSLPGWYHHADENTVQIMWKNNVDPK
jgi:hypothetical protein